MPINQEKNLWDKQASDTGAFKTEMLTGSILRQCVDVKSAKVFRMNLKYDKFRPDNQMKDGHTLIEKDADTGSQGRIRGKPSLRADEAAHESWLCIFTSTAQAIQKHFLSSYVRCPNAIKLKLCCFTVWLEAFPSNRQLTELSSDH